VLVIDELGYLPMDATSAHWIFQVVSRRYERGSIVLTSNRGFGDWGAVFADGVVATAILDRLLHHATVVNIRGQSYRMRARVPLGRRALLCSADLDRLCTSRGDLSAHFVLTHTRISSFGWIASTAGRIASCLTGSAGVVACSRW